MLNVTPSTPQHPQNTTYMTITNFNYEGSYEVGISFYFLIMTSVNTKHCTVMSDVTLLDTPKTPQNIPHMTIKKFNYEGSYLPGLICNIVVKVNYGRSPSNASWDIHYGMYLAAILHSLREGWNFLLFLNSKV